MLIDLLSVMNKEFRELGLKKEDCMENSRIQSVLNWARVDNKTFVLLT